MKKTISSVIMAILLGSILVGCGGDNVSGGTTKGSKEIVVVTREEGSGTRGAFIELIGIEEKDANGNKIDRTTKEAITQMKTDTVITTVAGNENAIGYISLGSLNDTVKALDIEGVSPTTTNVKTGLYKVARPFNIALKSDVGEVAKDFINFIMSKEGQDVIGESYISIDDNARHYDKKDVSGKIVVAGSSSVTPVMEKLKEAYLEINPNVEIEIQQSDSTSGMNAVIDGIADIGMASRELKDSEKENLTPIAIALDGIAVVVNPKNPITDITSETVKEIFTGELTLWEDIK